MSIASDHLSLAFGFAFEDLYAREGLVRLDRAFLDYLRTSDSALSDRLLGARENPSSLARKAASELIVAVAPHLEDFIGQLFGIEDDLRDLQARHHALAPLYAVKRKFVQRKAVTSISRDEAMLLDGAALASDLESLFDEPLTELTFARFVDRWLQAEAEYKIPLHLAAQYAAWATLTPAGQKKHHTDVLFRVPHKVDPHHLVPVETVSGDGLVKLQLHPDHYRHREGFKLTDPGMDLTGALDEAHYCIKCHNQGKDSCSTGLKEKTGEYKKSVFGVTLAGCPLEEKISEMNVVKQRGNAIGALAIVTIDNPMCAGTGHRICNDCMKSCIYQKQDPVDIPQVETRTLKDVLELPWGFEIYSLLTRWNPLNFERPVPKTASGYKVLVVGLGPAGFTLAHHLMNDGHTVVGIDGLKIEPLPVEVSGVDPIGRRGRFGPIRDINKLYESLDDRVMAGFGGVAEYGITVRWNKNFLKIIRLLLERRARIRDVRRSALWRHADHRQRVRIGLRSHRAVRGRGPADRDPDEERAGARRAAGVRFSDGAAVDRRGETRFGRESAGPDADGGDRRRLDRDRYGDGIAGVLRGAGGEIPRALREVGGGEGRARSS